MKVLIIGAGPSGLVALKEMLAAGLDASVIEKASALGGVYRDDAVYEQMYLSNSNRFMAFSDFPDDTNPAKYLNSKEYVAYLEKYASHFGLCDKISFDTTVKQAKLGLHAKWEVEVESSNQTTTRTITADRLIVATGANQVPKYVPLTGFTGEVMHSKDFKNAANFKGKRVLVIGVGESSSDIAANIAEVAEYTANWSRRPVVLGPRYLCPKSNDETATLADATEKTKIWELLETATTSRMSQIVSPKNYNKLRIEFWEDIDAADCRDAVHLLSRICLHACQRVPDGMERSDQVSIVTKSNRMPQAVVSGKLDFLVAKSASFDGNKVSFSSCTLKNFDIIQAHSPDSTQEMEVDTIIMCTGYQTKFDWLELPNDADVGHNPRMWFKHCIPPGYEDKLAFLGWTRPHQGGIPCCSEMLSRYLALLYTGQRVLPQDWKEQTIVDAAVSDVYWSESVHYKNLCDYPSFMTSIATLIGCLPRPPPIWNLKRFVQFYTFPVWPAFYRSHGPGANPTVMNKLLDQYGAFDAISPFHTKTLKLGIMNATMNYFFYASSFLFGDSGDGMGCGWYWAKSKQFVGLHGVNMRAKDAFSPFLNWFGWKI